MYLPTISYARPDYAVNPTAWAVSVRLSENTVSEIQWVPAR